MIRIPHDDDPYWPRALAGEKPNGQNLNDERTGRAGLAGPWKRAG